jgi:hypothetical protein
MPQIRTMGEPFYKRMLWLRSALAYSPTWLNLSRIGRLRVLRTSYFWLVAVPVVAKWFQHANKWPVFEDVLQLTFTVPFSWRVFYFSSIAFAAATTVYSLRCPWIIRDFKHFAEFEELAKSPQLIQAALLAAAEEEFESDITALNTRPQLSTLSRVIAVAA